MGVFSESEVHPKCSDDLLLLSDASSLLLILGLQPRCPRGCEVLLFLSSSGGGEKGELDTRGVLLWLMSV